MSISVNSVSLVPHLARNTAGSIPHRPPPMAAARHITGSSSPEGQLFWKVRAK